MKSSLEETLAFQITVTGLPKPEREKRFHPTRRWRLDFFWGNPHYIAAEVDGGTFSSGRHSRGLGYQSDCEKLNYALLMGIRVFRFTGKDVKSGAAVRMLEAALGEPK